MILDKGKNEITLVEIGITNQDSFVTVETEKTRKDKKRQETTRKYDLLANKLGQLYKCKVKIILYVMTWEGIVTKFHKKYMKELEITPEIQAYIQSEILKCTLESISSEYTRGCK